MRFFEWLQFLKIAGSLNNMQPVYMCGKNTVNSEGHAWVVDGYRIQYDTHAYYAADDLRLLDRTRTPEKNYVHCNWGWDGYCNGYYLYNALKSSGYVDYDFNYSKNLQVITGITYNKWPLCAGYIRIRCLSSQWWCRFSYWYRVVTMTIPLTTISFFFALVIAVITATIQYAKVRVLKDIVRFYIHRSNVCQYNKSWFKCFRLFFAIAKEGWQIKAIVANNDKRSFRFFIIFAFLKL